LNLSKMLAQSRTRMARRYGRFRKMEPTTK
jgi:hypothetical protein